MMAFFEGFIQGLSSFLEDLAVEEGSVEKEYTQVHGVCDIAHTQGLFRGLAAEMALNPPAAGTDLFEGVDLLATLIQNIVQGGPGRPARGPLYTAGSHSADCLRFFSKGSM